MSIQRQIEILEPFVTENKRQLMEEVMDQRTRFLTVVLEDIHKPHNASAVLRTCECMGIQDIHTIERKNVYQVNPYVVRGASKWLTIYHHKEFLEGDPTCVDRLLDDGYEIVTTTVEPDGQDPEFFELNKKIAVFFGNEHAGVSEETHRRASRRIKIPMSGFTDSYNLSVSVAIIMNDLMRKLRRSDLVWSLTESERTQLKLEWYKAVVKNSEIVLANLMG